MIIEKNKTNLFYHYPTTLSQSERNQLGKNTKEKLNSETMPEIFASLYTDTALERYYQSIVCQDLCLKQNYKNIMECASLQKVVCNTSSKHYASDKEFILPALTALEMITGQKPKYTCAKKSISTFKLRQFQILGCKTTLRKTIMYRFLEKYITIVSIRMKDWNETKLKPFTNKGSKDFVVLNSHLFPELQQHDELFQNITGIQLSFSSTSLAKIQLLKEKDGMLLYSAFQLII